jgi:transposase
MARRYDLTDAQWRRVEDLLPGKKSDPGRTSADNRLFVNAVLWVLRSGAHCHDLPERYGNYKTVHKRFGRWADAGVWEQIFKRLIDDPPARTRASRHPHQHEQSGGLASQSQTIR